MSFRRAHASPIRGIDAELLAPERARRAAPSLAPRDLVEDAEFEVIQAAADFDVSELASARPASPSGAQTALRMRERLGAAPTGNERLGLFDRAAERFAVPPPRPPSVLVPLVAGSAIFALAVMWMAGGHTVFTGRAEVDRIATASIPPPPASPTIAAAADPSQPAAVVVAEPETATAAKAPTMTARGSAGSIEVIGPATRPARVERAGSIMMIRSGN